MAFTMGTALVRSALAAASKDGADTFEQKGAIVCTTIDISAYVTAGITVSAGELGLSEIYGVIAQVEELAGVANNEFVSGVAVAADRKSCIFECQQDDASTGIPAESSATNIGIISVVAFGEIAGGSDNV